MAVVVGGCEHRLAPQDAQVSLPPPRHLQFLPVLKDAATAMERLLALTEEDDFDEKSSWKKDAESDGVVVYHKDLKEGRFFAASVRLRDEEPLRRWCPCGQRNSSTSTGTASMRYRSGTRISPSLPGRDNSRHTSTSLM